MQRSSVANDLQRQICITQGSALTYSNNTAPQAPKKGTISSEIYVTCKCKNTILYISAELLTDPGLA